MIVIFLILPSAVGFNGNVHEDMPGGLKDIVRDLSLSFVCIDGALDVRLELGPEGGLWTSLRLELVLGPRLT